MTCKPDNLFEQNINSPRWQAVKKISDHVLVDSFAKGERKAKFVQWFTSFMNALYYAIDFPNYKTNFFSLLKLGFYSAYYGLFGRVAKKERKKNITQPNLEITKLIFESYECKIIGFIYNLLRLKTKLDVKFSLKIDKDCLIMKKNNTNGFDNDCFNFRLLTDIEDIKFRDNQVYQFKRNSNFYQILNNKLAQKDKMVKSQAYPEYNILFYIHGGGFLSQTTESSVGFLAE